MNTSAVTMQTATVRLPLPSLPATVGAYFAARLCVTYLFFQSDPQFGAMVSFALNMLLLVAVGFYSFGRARNTLASMLREPCIRWVFAFLGFSLCSLVWSETVSVAIAFAYWCGMAVDVAMVILLLRAAQIEEVAGRLLKGYVAGACIVACVMWLSPHHGGPAPGQRRILQPPTPSASPVPSERSSRST